MNIGDEQRRAIRKVLSGQEDTPVTLETDAMDDEPDPAPPAGRITAAEVLEIVQQLNPLLFDLACERALRRRLETALAAR